MKAEYPPYSTARAPLTIFPQQGGMFGFVFTDSGPDWIVDSFFDIHYKIEFVGEVGSPLEGFSGSSLANRTSGMHRSTSSKRIFSSTRARLAPRQ